MYSMINIINTALLVKNPPGNAGDSGLIRWLGRSPGGGNGNPRQYSCLESAMDSGAWRAAVHGVTRSDDLLAENACMLFIKVVKRVNLELSSPEKKLFFSISLILYLYEITDIH